MNGPGPISAPSPQPVNYTVLPSSTAPLSSDLVRQWIAANRKAVQNLSATVCASIPTGSGGVVDQNDNISFLTTGSTAGSRSGISWLKGTGPVVPGIGHYHNAGYNHPLFVSFQFGFFTTLAAGTGVIGYFGTDNIQRPTDLSWVPIYAGFGFKILADGSLHIYIDNRDAGTHNIYTTGATVDVTGNASCLLQEILFISDGTGNVFVWLNNSYVGVFTGMQATEAPANDVYPMIAQFNEPSGTATTHYFGVFPLEIMVKPY